ncbi:MAG TPA: class I SAM-dependent methyltransferase [Luteitalea sp.]|nr:class I SAM-dependent methyltransferase [Luteitalea sp.]
MSTILPELLRAFAERGLSIRAEAGETRTNDPDAQFVKAFRDDGTRLRGGAGMAFGEVLFLEHLLAPLRGQCLIIGNGFGWSSVALGMLLRGKGHVTAMDACVDGDEAEAGLALVEAIAAAHDLPVRAVRAVSPEDVTTVVERDCGGRLDLVLIDGLHSEEQQALDYEAVRPFLADGAVVLFHDIVNWRLEAGFAAIAARDGRGAALLHRTASGMAILYPETAPYVDLIDAFRGDAPVRQPDVAIWERRYEGLWRSYVWRGDTVTSEKYFTLALGETLAPARLWLARAWLHFDRAEWDACRDALTAAEGLAPHDAAPRYWQAMVARATGATATDVQAAFAHALRGDGVTAEMRMDAGFASFAAGDWEDADRLARATCAERDGWSAPWHLRALCARARGACTTDVAALLTKASTATPMTPELAYDLASVAQQTGQMTDALRHARIALTLRPRWDAAATLVEALESTAEARA